MDGVPFYFRSRGNRWSLGVGFRDTVGIAMGVVPGFRRGDSYGEWPEAGYMPLAEAREIIWRSYGEWQQEEADNS